MSPTFTSLHVRNYRLYATGGLVSNIGTWMQRVAQDWLVLQLSGHSGVALGITTGLQFLPMLLLAPFAGTLADRFEGKRFNAPNDIVVRHDNHAYFTDPAFGNQAEGRELSFFGVYHVSPKGEVEVIARPKGRPNGVALAPGGKTLYVTNSDEKKVYAYDLDNRLVQVTDPMGGVTRYQYNAQDKQTRIIDANGGVIDMVKRKSQPSLSRPSIMLTSGM